MSPSNPNEFYETPAWCVHRLLERVAMHGAWLDPCAGNGALPIAVREVTGTLTSWMTVDKVAHERVQVARDYLDPSMHWTHRFDGCLMNPPFSKAMAFAQKAVTHCDQVYMLQRLSWMQSQDRSEWLRDNPFDLFVLPERPSFTGDGKTDAAGYGWYSWPTRGLGVVMLGNTPRETRNQPNAGGV